MVYESGPDKNHGKEEATPVHLRLSVLTAVRTVPSFGGHRSIKSGRDSSLLAGFGSKILAVLAAMARRHTEAVPRNVLAA